MDDELKRQTAKRLAQLRAHSDMMWAKARDSRKKFSAIATKKGPMTPEDITTLRLAAGIVLAQLLVNHCEVEASKYLTPDEEDKYGGTDA
jgi:hypothetical protein